MPRRPWFLRLDLFGALERLRSFDWRDRLNTFFKRRPRSTKDDGKTRKSSPELLPLGWRNPPSESIGNVALPLAMTAAAVAAAVYIADAQAAAESRSDPRTEGAAGDYDTSSQRSEGGGGGGGGGEDFGSGSLTPGSVNEWLYGASGFVPGGNGDDSPAGPDGGSGSKYDDALGSEELQGMGAPDPWRIKNHLPAMGGDSPESSTPQLGANTSVNATTGDGLPTTPTPAPSGNGSNNNSINRTAVAATTPNTDNPGRRAAGQQAPSRSNAERQIPSNATRFAANAGQWDSSVDFAAQGAGYEFWMAGDATVLASTPSGNADGTTGLIGSTQNVVTVTWEGMNSNSQPTGGVALTSVANFSSGPSTNQSHNGVAEYAGVRYSSAWDGIDLVYRSARNGDVDYALDVAPGANLSLARFQVQGAEASIEYGKLVLTTPSGAVFVESSPVLYQMTADGVRQKVAGGFEIGSDGAIRFWVGKYDPSRELVVDPHTDGGGSGNLTQIGGWVWVDSNANGIQDSGESGLPGVTVKLWSGATLVSTAVSDSTGDYDLGELSAGTYQVQFVTPAGYTLTAQNQGSDDTVDSDPDPTTGYTDSISLATSQALDTVDAGMIPLPLDPPVITGMTTDTGASSSDRVTSDTTPTLLGTAAASSTVTIYRQGPADSEPVVAGTTTASGGSWSFTVPSALAAGDYHFTATDTVSGFTSASSDPLTVVLDTAAPILTLAVVSQTYDVRPQITARVTDPAFSGGLAGTTTVTLDADLNNNGNFTDAGETGYATATLVNGVATFTGYTPLIPGTTVRFQARVTDLAGNQGTSAAQSVQVLNSSGTWTTTGDTSDARSGYGGMWGWTTVADGLVYAGNVTTSHPLDLNISATTCSCQNPYLDYNSQEGTPAPTVQATVRSDNALALPSHVYGTLTWDGTTGSTIDYNLTALSPGGDWVFAAAPASSLSTGRHTYSLSLFVDYAGTSNDHLLTLTGDTFVVNRSASPYGAGWSFSNTDTLVSIAADGTYPAGVLREFGKGGYAFYTDAGGGTYTSPAGDGGTLMASGGGWIYSSADGKVLDFDSSGHMTSWTDLPADETLTYTYDASGGVATVKDPDGSIATFNYSGGMLSTITAAGGRSTSLTFTGSDLTQITDPAGGTHTFTYSGHLLTGETFGALHEAYTYSNGLAATTQLGSDTASSVSPGIAAGLTAGATAVTGGVVGSITDGLGATTKTSYNSFGQPVQTQATNGAIQRYGRNANGFVIDYVDPLNRETTFAVDLAGRILGETFPDGTHATWAYGGANGALTQYATPKGGLWTYTNDANGDPLTATDPLNHTTSFIWSNGLLQTITDPLGNVETLIYDAQRRLTGMLLGGAVTGTVGYDIYGNANTFTDALGKVSTVTYDASGYLTAKTDALGNTTTYLNDAAGNLLSMTDPLGNVTSFGYDNSGRIVTEIDAYGTGLARTLTYVYDADGQLIATVNALGSRTTIVYDGSGQVIATVDALGNRTTNAYDPAGELISTTDPLTRVTSYGYDLLSRQVSMTNALGNTWTTVYDADSNVVATVDPLGHRATSVFDAADRMTASVDALGDTTSYSYDADDRQISTTDPDGNILTTAYDARGRVLFTEDALGNRTTPGYDADDNQIKLTDANNHTSSTVYDADNRVIATVDALGNRSTTIYDAAGNIIANVDPLGNRTSSVYDALNRSIATIDALGNRTTAVYDAADNVIATVDPLGNRTSAVYDADSRAIATIDALGNRTSSTFDAAGQLIATTDALGEITSYGYDLAGQQITTTDALGHTWTTGYDAAGRSITSTDPNGHTSSTVYDAADRTIASVDAMGDRTSYGYDAASNQTTTTDPLNHVSTTVYDADNRTVATIDAQNHRSTVVYDNVGNTIVAIDALNHRTTTGYDADNRAVTTTDALGNVWTTTYDAASNVVAQTDPNNHISTTVYDADNRAIVAVDALGNRTSTAYDAAGNVKTVTDANNHVTSFGYDADNQQVTTTDALGNVWTTLYDADGQQIASVDPLARRTTSVFDAANRTIASVDALGNRTTTIYDPAGNVIATVDPLGNRTSYGYDAADRQVTMTDALGNVSTTVYDAASNVAATVDPLGNRTSYVYDELNRQVRLSMPSTNAARPSSTRWATCRPPSMPSIAALRSATMP
jgi:YD repeat-containing protein